MKIDLQKHVVKLICAALIFLAVLSIAGMLWAQHLGFSRHSRTLAIMASNSFLLIALLGVGMYPSKYGICALVGLVFCWLGDFLGTRNFNLGLLMFLIAHLSFMVAFWFHKVDVKRIHLALMMFLFIGAAIVYWLYPFVPKGSRIPVFAYMIVITAMVVFAYGLVEGRGQRLIIIAAALFYISDIFVARWKFVDSGFINALLCYPLYYASCMFFALSIIYHRKEIAKPEESTA